MATSTRVKINVTEKDIERARLKGIGDSFQCVVSTTIARTIPDATHIDTDTQTIRFTVDGERRVYLTPYAVQGYVVAFDAGEPLEPFSFQLRDPRRVARKVNTPAGKAANRAGQKARREAATAIEHVATEGSTGPVETNKTSKAAKAAYAEARVAAKDSPASESDKGGPKAPPRVFKTKRRAYGHRLLRINQDIPF